MINLTSEQRSLIKEKASPNQAIDFKDSSISGLDIEMDFEHQMLIASFPTAEGGSTILSIPIATAFQLAIRFLEASSIINFANKIGLNLSNHEEE